MLAAGTNGDNLEIDTLKYNDGGPGQLDSAFSGDGIQVTPFMDGATLRASQAQAVAV